MSQISAAEIIVPATAGLIPATAVKKNEKYDTTKVYAAESPTEPTAYASISFIFSLFLLNP